MAEDKFSVTDEERQALSETAPKLLKLLDEKKDFAVAWLAGWRKRRDMGEEAFDQAMDLAGKVQEHTPAQQQQTLAQWFGFPTDMTRVSPFFPMNRNQLGEREFLRNYIITAAGWGEILYTGPKLSTYEEDALDAVLAMLDVQSKFKEETEIEGKRTYTYKGPAAPLLWLLGYKEKLGKNDYNRLIESLKLMTVSAVDLQISGGKTKKGKKRPTRRTSMSTMLINVDWDIKEELLSVTINPFFYETYYAGRVTLYDIKKRMALTSPVAKALYRFINSHRNPIWKGHLLTVVDALNMDREQEIRQLRRRIRTAINALIKENILTDKSTLEKGDIVFLERTKIALPEQKEKIKQIK